MSAPKNGNLGTYYLLHFDRPFHHAKHYQGWTSLTLEERLAAHGTGKGSKLMQAIKEEGIGYQVAVTFHNVDRNFERWMKNKGGAAKHCPLCRLRKENDNA